MPFKFEKLIVWQKAVGLSDLVNHLTKNFPKDELYVLTSQIKSAADSVSLNIAEGSTGQSNAEFARFLSIATRSDIEVVGCIHLAKRRGYIQEDNFNTIYKMCEEILVMLNSLKNSLTNKQKA
ncbi:MAG: four helix bundle protein [Bacteroidetes bacterium]|nr:four helix bundle protein [Bacteroidota bacterium]